MEVASTGTSGVNLTVRSGGTEAIGRALHALERRGEKALLPPEGAAVELDVLWRRRVARREVVATTEKEIAKGKAERLAAEAKAKAAEVKAAEPAAKE